MTLTWYHVYNIYQCRSTPLEDLESIRQVLVIRKCLLCAYFRTILTYADDTNGRLVKRKCPPTTLLIQLWRIKNALRPTIASVLPRLDDQEAMSFSAFDTYSAILAIISFQIAIGHGQWKYFDARVFRATSSRRTLTNQQQLAETFASRFGVSCKIFSFMYTLGLLMHKL